MRTTLQAPSVYDRIRNLRKQTYDLCVLAYISECLNPLYCRISLNGLIEFYQFFFLINLHPRYLFIYLFILFKTIKCKQKSIDKSVNKFKINKPYH